MTGNSKFSILIQTYYASNNHQKLSLYATIFWSTKSFWAIIKITSLLFHSRKLIWGYNIGSEFRKVSLSAWQNASFSSSVQGVVKIMILVTTKMEFLFSPINIRTIGYQIPSGCVVFDFFLRKPFSEKSWESRLVPFVIWYHFKIMQSEPWQHDTMEDRVI